MTVETFLATVAIATLAIWLSAQLYDWLLTWRGVFPKPSETTLEDIRRLRDQGCVGIAIKRFRQLPENRGIYTSKGADKMVSEL